MKDGKPLCIRMRHEGPWEIVAGNENGQVTFGIKYIELCYMFDILRLLDPSTTGPPYSLFKLHHLTLFFSLTFAATVT